ncbi:hypothetical protein [Streptomyces dysideae]|uniref:hypothetical protein n=1 Tax=Streptomyces dysideae TaxID=909626 RepID=UPI00131AD6C9|nr:hypothetical protein [Streptomyces dysideae]
MTDATRQTGLRAPPWVAGGVWAPGLGIGKRAVGEVRWVEPGGGRRTGGGVVVAPGGVGRTGGSGTGPYGVGCWR